MKTHGHGRRDSRFGRWIAGGLLLLSVFPLSCGRTSGRLTGQMFIPPGLRGTAQWGEIWLVQNHEQLRVDLGKRERLLVLTLHGKDADFMRAERSSLIELAIIRAKLEALNRGEIPVRVVTRAEVEITTVTPMDSVIAGISAVTRPATAPELATEIDASKQRLKEQAVAIRDRLEPSVTRHKRGRTEQKRVLLGGADGTATRFRVKSSPVGMDGRYFFDDVPVADYSLYSRYRLLDWFVLTPVAVTAGVVTQDIPRLPGVILDSKAVVSLDALCLQIARM